MNAKPVASLNANPGEGEAVPRPLGAIEIAPVEPAADAMDAATLAEPADLYWGKKTGGRGGRSPLKYRRFDTLAEALKFAVENLDAEAAVRIDTARGRLSSDEIRGHYNDPSFPLPRRSTTRLAPGSGA